MKEDPQVDLTNKQILKIAMKKNDEIYRSVSTKLGQAFGYNTTLIQFDPLTPLELFLPRLSAKFIKLNVSTKPTPLKIHIQANYNPIADFKQMELYWSYTHNFPCEGEDCDGSLAPHSIMAIQPYGDISFQSKYIYLGLYSHKDIKIEISYGFG